MNTKLVSISFVHQIKGTYINISNPNKVINQNFNQKEAIRTQCGKRGRHSISIKCWGMTQGQASSLGCLTLNPIKGREGMASAGSEEKNGHDHDLVMALTKLYYGIVVNTRS